jgi:hypothetical protein
VSYAELELGQEKPRKVRDWTERWEQLTPLLDVNGSVRARAEAFAASKRISLEAMAALGARVTTRRGGSLWLAYAGRNHSDRVVAIKYRPLDGGSHDSEAEAPSVWVRPIVVGKLDSLDWFVTEGETDAARLFDLLGDVAAILCLPAGAEAFRREWADLIPRGATVHLCHDADEHGEPGAEKAARLLGGKTVRVRPPEGIKDWCEWEGEREQFVELVRLARETQQRSLVGISHGELLKLEVPATTQLVEDVVEAGTVGTIAALPERYKSWVANELAFKVASAEGRLFGQAVITKSGPVGYWWQDDSLANEVNRARAYASRHGHSAELPIRWHLNEGLRLPDDIPALVKEIEDERQVLVILDSLYNFLPGLDLKDEAVAAVLQRVKTEVCDRTGATVCYVDHAPWPNEGNRGQRRGYGSVFKAAAIRWGIFLERPGSTLYLEATGNNVRGIKRSVAVWEEEELELRLVEVTPKSETAARIRELRENDPDITQAQVAAALELTERTIRKYWHEHAQESLLDDV